MQIRTTTVSPFPGLLFLLVVFVLFVLMSSYFRMSSLLSDVGRALGSRRALGSFVCVVGRFAFNVVFARLAHPLGRLRSSLLGAPNSILPYRPVALGRDISVVSWWYV